MAQLKRLELAARLLALLFGVLFLSLLTWKFTENWRKGDAYTWAEGTWKASDLQQHYLAGKMWRDQERLELYHGSHLGDRLLALRRARSVEPTEKTEGFDYVYPPLVAWSASWFADLAYPQWIQFWLAFLAFCYLAGLFLFVRTQTSALLRSPLCWIYLIGYPSFFFSLLLGQNAPLTFALFAVASWLLRNDRPWLAGWVVSCAFYKPQYMPYLALFLLVAGQWRCALAIGFGNLLWLAVGMLLCGFDSYQLWLTSLFQMISGAQIQVYEINISWRGFFWTLLGTNPGALASMLVSVQGVGLLLGIAWWVRALHKRYPSQWQATWTFGIALIMWLFVSPYVMHYEMILGIFWWLTFAMLPVPRSWRYPMVASFWILAYLAINPFKTQVAFLAPLTTTWLVLSIALTQRFLHQRVK